MTRLQSVIKNMIGRDGATGRNNNHFERPTILNAPGDEHSMMFFKSIADFCFIGPTIVNAQPRKVKYNKMWWKNMFDKRLTLTLNLRPWPTISA